MAEIRLENVAKAFGSFTAVNGVDLTVDHGAFFVILGPSGCGKTTTLRMTAGLELPTSGRILLDGEDVTALPASARDIAFVFQMFALYPHMNVRQNIGFPLKCQNYPRAEIRRNVGETARLLRIDHLLERRVGGLSGGDRQRAVDELPWPAGLAASRRSQHRGRRRPGGDAGNARGPSRRKICAWREAGECLVRGCLPPARPGDRRRVSWYDADRDGDDGKRPDQGEAAIGQGGPYRRVRRACPAARPSLLVRRGERTGAAIGALRGRAAWLRSRWWM